jgi:pyruvate formate lyase activating enzyme
MCGECVHYCPKDAWSFYGTGMMVKEVLAEVEKDRAFYNQSGGGVTISGGECTMQGEFLFELLKACKENSISTAIESNANASSEVYKQLSEYVDLFLLDVKHMDSTIHKKATGFGNDRVLSNIRMLTFEMGKKLSIRYPLIPGFNDSDENVLATVQFASEIAKSGNLYKVNILPYHSLGASKYEILGLNYTMSETKAPTQDNIDRVIKAFEKEGLPVLQGG